MRRPRLFLFVNLRSTASRYRPSSLAASTAIGPGETFDADVWSTSSSDGTSTFAAARKPINGSSAISVAKGTATRVNASLRYQERKHRWKLKLFDASARATNPLKFCVVRNDLTLWV